MFRAAFHAGRAGGLLAAGLVAGALVTGCAGTGTGSGTGTGTGSGSVPAAATRPATAAPATDTGGSDLAAGLLPATAFGDGAEVTPVPLGLLQHAAPMAGALAGVQVDRPECLTAV